MSTIFDSGWLDSGAFVSRYLGLPNDLTDNGTPYSKLSIWSRGHVHTYAYSLSLSLSLSVSLSLSLYIYIYIYTYTYTCRSPWSSVTHVRASPERSPLHSGPHFRYDFASLRTLKPAFFDTSQNHGLSVYSAQHVIKHGHGSQRNRVGLKIVSVQYRRLAIGEKESEREITS